MMRKSGVLLHLTSLPGQYGIGCFDEEALAFAEKINEAGFSYWQLLPLLRPGRDNSPYRSDSAFAGNELLIDPGQMFDIGLITDEELDSAVYQGSAHAVNYDWVRQNRSRLFTKAAERISESYRQEVLAFVSNNKWVKDFATYAALKKHFQNKAWWEWPEEALVRCQPEAVEAFVQEHEAAYFLECFTQYEFYRQWKVFRQAVQQRGVKLIGDLPIYVSEDSAEVWSHRELFLTDDEGLVSHVAGIPPDSFAPSGQIWGHPLYDWSHHQKSDFQWWMERLEWNLSMYDRLRITHFPGFRAFFSIPKGKSPQEGEWCSAPGHKLIERLRQIFPEAEIIAEDLGARDEVNSFVMEAGFPDTRVFQYAFDPSGNSPHLPHNYDVNTVAYTSTHDNNTLLGWLWSSSEEEKRYVANYCAMEDLDWGRGGPQSPPCHSMIQQVWQSAAQLTIVPLQDILGYGEDTRMNTPGTDSGNWTFRISHAGIESMDCQWLYQMNQLYRRLP